MKLSDYYYDINVFIYAYIPYYNDSETLTQSQRYIRKYTMFLDDYKEMTLGSVYSTHIEYKI